MSNEYSFAYSRQLISIFDSYRLFIVVVVVVVVVVVSISWKIKRISLLHPGMFELRVDAHLHIKLHFHCSDRLAIGRLLASIWIGLGLGWDWAGIGLGLGLDWAWIGLGLGLDWAGIGLGFEVILKPLCTRQFQLD